MTRTLTELARACQGRLIGADGDYREVVIDTRKLVRTDVFAALAGEKSDGHQFVEAAATGGAAAVIVSRQMTSTVPQIVVADVATALTAAARVWRERFSGPVIGVAGSNGKTTVKEMISAVLEQRGACLATRGNLNNHLGVPLTLLRLEPTHWSAVVEMGANRQGDVENLVQIARPSVGVITNAGAEHLEGFGSLEGAARAEGEMVAGLAPDGVAVINADDEFAPLWRAGTRARVLDFGLQQGAVRAEQLRFDVDAQGFSTRFRLRTPQGQAETSLTLAGRHNVLNALAAAAAALSAGATLSEVVAGLATVRAVKGRLQFRRSQRGAWIIDDSYNANPSSGRAGLEVLAELPGRRWLVLGDMAELGDFSDSSHREIGELARSLGVERLFTFGRLAALAADSFGTGAERYQDIAELTRALDAALTPDVRVLIKGSRVNRLERVVDGLLGELRQVG